MGKDIVPTEAEIEYAERTEGRADYEPLFRSVGGALDEWLSRFHGVTSSHNHAGQFVRWLSERGVLVVDAGRLDPVVRLLGLFDVREDGTVLYHSEEAGWQPLPRMGTGLPQAIRDALHG